MELTTGITIWIIIGVVVALVIGSIARAGSR